MTPRDIVLVTCAQWPDLSTSDACLAAELEALGHRIRGLAWNTSPLSEFTAADLVVLRSNWDYHHDLDAFTQWLTEIGSSPAELRNPIDLVRDHLDKSYIDGLRSAGVRAPRSLVTNDFDIEQVHAWTDTHELDRVVLKPTCGASGHGVELVGRDDLHRAAERWRTNPDRRPMLIQEFVPEIRNGEQALVFFGGEYSHTLIRRPARDDFRVNSQYGGSMQLQPTVDPSAVEFAQDVIAALSEAPTYARIDVVSTEADYMLMEVEVNEPALGLHLAPGSASRFAHALLRDQ